MFTALVDAPRLLLEVALQPVQGARFQPTGFADLGPAVYERPDGTRMLLVESAQSMANRLEKTCLDGDGPELAPALAGLPYVRVELIGDTRARTSSLVEAHRINSPYIISDKPFQESVCAKGGYREGQPLDWKRLAQALLYYDPNSLVHGVFMANVGDGRIRFPRMVSAFIEAEGAREAFSGGVKNNPVDPSGTLRVPSHDKDVYGNVPFHRVEFTATRITAYFNLDLALLRGYGLPQEAQDLLLALGLYKIRRLLSTGLRLRTACDLDPGEIQVQRPTGFVLPDEPALLAAIQKHIERCRKAELIGPVTELKVEVKRKEKEGKDKGDKAAGRGKNKRAAAEAEGEPGDDMESDGE